jgi:hypothetical protein
MYQNNINPNAMDCFEEEKKKEKKKMKELVKAEGVANPFVNLAKPTTWVW